MITGLVKSYGNFLFHALPLTEISYFLTKFIIFIADNCSIGRAYSLHLVEAMNIRSNLCSSLIQTDFSGYKEMALREYIALQFAMIFRNRLIYIVDTFVTPF